MSPFHDIRGGGRGDRFALLQACYDLDVAGAANADLEVSQ